MRQVLLVGASIFITLFICFKSKLNLPFWVRGVNATDEMRDQRLEISDERLEIRD